MTAERVLLAAALAITSLGGTLLLLSEGPLTALSWALGTWIGALLGAGLVLLVDWLLRRPGA